MFARLAFVLAFILPLGMAVADVNAPLPTGRWITANHSAVIQISPCGADLCGQIVGLALTHPNDPLPTNWRGGPQCGMMIIQTAPGTDSTGKHIWTGSVLDPRNGNVYHAQIMVDDFRHLLLHGYIGLPIFGQTQTWFPFSGRTLGDCRMAAAQAPSAG